jgi:hypothetical protein
MFKAHKAAKLVGVAVELKPISLLVTTKLFICMWVERAHLTLMLDEQVAWEKLTGQVGSMVAEMAVATELVAVVE